MVRQGRIADDGPAVGVISGIFRKHSEHWVEWFGYLEASPRGFAAGVVPAVHRECGRTESGAVVGWEGVQAQ